MFDSILSALSYDASSPLLFNSGLFFVLFLGFYLGYILGQANRLFRLLYVLAFSLFFYYKCSGYFVVLLLLSTVWDFFLGRKIAACSPEQQGLRRLYLILSLLGNLGMLAYFKYTNFFIDTLNNLGGTSFASWDIILPVGISFYTFQTLSYSIDIYRGQLEPRENILDFAFFVSFFPQLVAGPIVRASDFLPQIRKDLSLSEADLSRGFWLIMGGLFKKVVISDYIGVNFVDRVFDEPLLYTGTENLLAVYGYCIQIYGDFSGYSDMAIGLALLMGFQLPDNFNSPYKASSITDFWRRWHISLSSWLRDYLYISLGGNRRGNIRTYINLALTMLLGGLWHGANWKFVFWGFLHGMALAVERFFKPWVEVGKRRWFMRALGYLWAFHFVAYCWIYFRAESMQKAHEVLSQIFFDWHWAILPQWFAGFWKVALLMFLGFFLHFLPRSVYQGSLRIYTAFPLPLKALIFALLVWLLIQMQNADVQAFIYFQF